MRVQEQLATIDIRQRVENHPCFDRGASKQFGRMHLPVAPKCNISCNYCNRKYDCSNECRPGVTSKVLSPEEAFAVFEEAFAQKPELTTVGIAGPGDSLANPDQTFALLEKIHSKYPQINLCISTNGLMLGRFAKELLDVNAKFITMTVNAVTADTAAKVYRSVRYDGQTFRGYDAASLLLEKQREGLEKLRGTDGVVKINTVYIPEVNPSEIPAISEMGRENGVYLMNVTPLIPVAGSQMEFFRTPSDLEIQGTRSMISKNVTIMDHCQQCRSDACGLLTDKKGSVHDIQESIQALKAGCGSSESKIKPGEMMCI